MKRWIPTREQLLANRWLQPVAHYLHDDRLWHLERGSVARAAAIGVFFGFLIPVAQIFFAVILAIVLRSHVAIAAAATLVTNPLTFPVYFWAAYRVGDFVLGGSGATPPPDALHSQAQALAAAEGWWSGLVATIQNAGAPLLLGMALFAVCGSALAYALVWLLWRRRGHADAAPPA